MLALCEAVARHRPGSGPLEGWVTTAIRNRLADVTKRQAWEEDKGLAGGSPVPDAAGAAQVRELVEGLPFVLRYYARARWVEGRTVKSIAAECGLCEDTVSARLRQAEAELRTELQRGSD